MCLDGGVIIGALVSGLLTAATSAVSGSMQAKQQNQVAMAQYKYQQEQQALINKQVQDQYAEQTRRQQLDANRQATSAFEQAQQSILENQRRQAAAMATAGSSGITGLPLQTLFNDFQVAVGGISSNLDRNYSQINENLFFSLDNSRREAQNRINAAVPAPPLMNSYNPMNAVMSGVGQAISVGLKGYGSSRGGGASPSGTTSYEAPPTYTSTYKQPSSYWQLKGSY